MIYRHLQSFDTGEAINMHDTCRHILVIRDKYTLGCEGGLCYLHILNFLYLSKSQRFSKGKFLKAEG